MRLDRYLGPMANSIAVGRTTIRLLVRTLRLITNNRFV